VVRDLGSMVKAHPLRPSRPFLDRRRPVTRAAIRVTWAGFKAACRLSPWARKGRSYLNNEIVIAAHIRIFDWVPRGEDQHPSVRVEHRSATDLHPLAGFIGAGTHQPARVAMPHEDVPYQVDVSAGTGAAPDAHQV